MNRSRPFLRAGSLLYAAANVTLASVELAAVLIARRHGASAAAIGVAFAVIGAGGVASALLAGPIRRRLTARWSVLAESWFAVAFMPLLLVCHSALPLITGLFFQHPGETTTLLALTGWTFSVALAATLSPSLPGLPTDARSPSEPSR